MPSVYTYRQTSQSECGLCCIATVAGYFGFYRSLGFYRSMINVGRDGMTLWDIAHFFPKIDINAEALKISNPDGFKVEKGYAYIFCKEKHFITVTYKNETEVYVHDPASGSAVKSIQDVVRLSSSVYLLLKPTSEFKASGHRPSELSYIFTAIKSVQIPIIIISLVSISIYILSLISQIIIKEIINGIAYSTFTNLRTALLAILGIGFLIIIIQFVRNEIAVKLQVKLSYLISYDTISNLFQIRYSYFDNRSPGEILYRLGFMSQLQQTVSSSTVQILISSAGLLTILFYLCFNYSFLVIPILLASAAIFLSSLLANEALLKLRREEFNSKKHVDSQVTEIINNMMQIRSMSLSNYFLRLYDQYFRKYISNYSITERKYYNYSSTLSTVFDLLPAVLLLLIFLFRTTAGLTIGEIFILFTLIGSFFNQCFAMVTQIAGLGSLRASMCFFNDLLYEPRELQSASSNIDEFQKLELHNVSFRYSDVSPKVIDNVSLKIEKGKCIAIVGLSGSGKTTLVKLLSKLYTPTQGEIMYNAINLSCISNEAYSKFVAVVPQLPVYFTKSIRDNITLDDPLISDNDIVEVLRIVNFIDDVKNMPFGLDTIVSGQGGNLSGGQIQKISLARAIIRHPQLLILDEATSSLDPWNEKEIFKNLKRAGISLLIISHRFTTVQHADSIHVVSKGRIVEQGTHDDLVRKRGIYFELFQSEQGVGQN